MRKIFVALTLAVSLLTLLPVLAHADSLQGLIGVALQDDTVQIFVHGFRASHAFDETISVTDNGDGTASVSFFYTPREGGPNQFVAALVDIDDRVVLSVSAS